MASRSKAKAEQAIADLKQLTGREAIFLELDLANLKSVKKAAEEFLRYVLDVFLRVRLLLQGGDIREHVRLGLLKKVEC